MTLVTCINPPELDIPPPVYSQVVLAHISPTTTQFTIAGQIALDPKTSEVPPDLPSQVDVCLKRLSVCLEAANATPNDLTRVMYYIAERGWDGDATVNMLVEKVNAWLGETARPASCLLVSKALSKPEYLCEFEASGVVARKTA